MIAKAIFAAEQKRSAGQIRQAIARRVGIGKHVTAKAASLGDIKGLIHAAGVSPLQASPATILKVDLYGTALVLLAM